MRHIHTSIVFRHLATRGNNKTLRTPPPHISSSEERLRRLTLAQLRTNNLPSSHHTYTKSTPNHIHHHYAPSATPTHTTHTISSTAPTYAPHCHPWICGQIWRWWCGEIWWLVDQRRDRTPPPPHRQGSMELVDTNKTKVQPYQETNYKPMMITII